MTDRERALRRLRILDTVRERVGRSLDMVVTCQELADALVPEFADVAVVELVEAVICGYDPPSPLPSCVTLRRAAFRSSAGEDAPQAHPVGHVEVLPAPTPFSRALAEQLSQAVDLTPDPPWLETDPARGRAIRASRAHSLLVVPLTLRDAVLGSCA
ncbi:hypothetical protein ABZV31_11260 [Streptomyces sp. NPDC005202]|uniref:hypothetical protein n=1 Tax=Streptomyces sp. NPDC005202 TaxID=3157021 RepID=UPI0033AA35C8